MNVHFIEEAPNAHEARKIIFSGKNYIPRLEDKVRVGSDIYTAIHVEWVYPNFSEEEIAMRKKLGMFGCEPHHVEVLMRPLPIEEPKPARKSEGVRPFKQEVQTNNCFCCRCGGGLPQGLDRWHAVVPLDMGPILAVQRISWCIDCWSQVPGSSSCPE